MKTAISFIKSCDGAFCDTVSQLLLLALSTFVIVSCITTLAQSNRCISNGGLVDRRFSVLALDKGTKPCYNVYSIEREIYYANCTKPTHPLQT